MYSANLHKHYLLLDPDWKEDIMPEIMDGHNIADFIDADILQRLDELEREEEEAAATAQAADEDEDMSDQVPPQDTYPNQIILLIFAVGPNSVCIHFLSWISSHKNVQCHHVLGNVSHLCVGTFACKMVLLSLLIPNFL